MVALLAKALIAALHFVTARIRTAYLRSVGAFWDILVTCISCPPVFTHTGSVLPVASPSITGVAKALVFTVNAVCHILTF